MTVAFAVHRYVVVTARGVPGGSAVAVDPFDDRYNRHPLSTYAHVVPGLLFMTLGPLQFSRRIRARWLGFHRWSGRIFLLCATVGALSSMAIAVRFPAWGGSSTAVATYFFGLLFLFCLARAYYYIRRKQIPLHREWMIRAFAIGLGVSTIRVVLILIQVVWHLKSYEAFPTAFWLGFSVNLIAAEVWINLSRPREAFSYQRSDIS
ncbi:MAG TPA: DUF2306 domain-containing protein [Acidobacteriota bacterium]|nr:DUF2306 domain-containing protein [Acidobacteriota bacterium]